MPRLRVPQYARQMERVAEAVSAGALAHGPHQNELRERLEEYFGGYVVLTSSGFDALFLALRQLAEDLPGAAEGRVAMPAAGTCFAIVNAIKAAGWTPELTDMEPETLSLAKTGENRLAVIPHHFGRRASLSRPSGALALIDDAAQSFLSFRALPADSRAMVVSFYPTKGVNGIAGGAIVTSDKDFARRCSELGNYSSQSLPGRTRYSATMSNVNAAFLLGTLDHLEEIRHGLESNHARLAGCVPDDAGVELLPLGEDDCPTRFVLRAESQGVRDNWIRRADRMGIASGLEMLPLWDGTGQGRYPVAAAAVERVFSLPLWPTMTEVDLTAVEAMLEGMADHDGGEGGSNDSNRT